ncbi:MAG TPA: tetratricopeptide repeat protein [Candidatus Tidjanibacter gallistercoris]|nr:tetratricopeptide repeat protein [Candidatus Tidjanibacter gallistercoris]
MNYKKIIAGIMAAAGFVSCTVVSRGTSPTGGEFGGGNAPYYYHAEGIKAHTVKGDAQAAVACFEQAIRADSTYAPGYYEIAEILLEEHPERAVRYSETANALDTSNLAYQNQLGRALVMAEKYDEAMGIYTRLMRDDPHNPLNYRLLAALYDYKGQPFTAIAILDTAEMRLGRIEELGMYKREILIRVRLYDKALEETKKLAHDYPYDESNYRVLGDIYSAMGEDSLALANYGEAIRLDSSNTTTLSSLADFYRRSNDAAGYLSTLKRIFENDGVPLEGKRKIFADVTSDLDFYRRNYFAINSLISTLIARYPDDYGVVDLYAMHLIRGGEPEQGLRLYKSFVGIAPDTPEAYTQIIGLETYLERPDSVAKYADMALARFPDRLDIRLAKGYARLSMKDTAGAIRTFREAYRTAPDDSTRSVVAGIVGDVYHEIGDVRRAYARYGKALRLDPDNSGVLNNYAYYLSEEGKDLEKALAMVRRANELSPGNATFLDTEGWILYLLGRYDEAKPVMQQAVSFDMTDSPVLLFHYAEILYALGDTFMAEVYWKRALEKGYDEETVRRRLETTKE